MIVILMYGMMCSAWFVVKFLEAGVSAAVDPDNKAQVRFHLSEMRYTPVAPTVVLFRSARSARNAFKRLHA